MFSPSPAPTPTPTPTPTPPLLKPFSHTHVVYDGSDPLGPLWALLSLAPPFYVIAITTQLVVGRDLRAGFVLSGLLITAATSTALKGWLDQPRPAGLGMGFGGTRTLPPSQTGGMPSNHASFVAFAAIFATLHAARRGGAVRGPTAAVRAAKRWGAAAFLDTVALGCSYSRVRLGYHTPAQVYAGAALGAALGAAFYWLYGARYVARWGPALERSRWLDAFDFRSPHDVDDALWWKGALDEQRQRNRADDGREKEE